jgi:alanine racemase
MTELFRRTFAEINLDSLSHNFFEIQKVAGPDRFLCPMVKANGYGHGDIQVAKHLEKCGAENIGVCLIEEGLLLRNSGVKSDILVFRGFDKYGAQKMLDHQMTPVLSTWDQIQILETLADDPVSVHLKFNTGMNRLGFNPNEAEKLFTYFKNSKKLKLKAILSHFYNGEDAQLENGNSHRQAKQMQDLLIFFKPLNVFAHLLNSGGIASLAQVQNNNSDHYLKNDNWGFRPGLILYGYQPHLQFTKLDLKPVMSLKSVVNNIRDVQKGESVSYGAQWTATSDAKIAVVPIGYADGVHRLLSNQAHVLFSGELVPIVGRICMDFLMLDITKVIDKNPNKNFDEEEVILFGFDQIGNFLSAQSSATAAQTITWEILTSVGERVPRLFTGGQNI